MTARRLAMWAVAIAAVAAYVVGMTLAPWLVALILGAALVRISLISLGDHE